MLVLGYKISYTIVSIGIYELTYPCRRTDSLGGGVGNGGGKLEMFHDMSAK